MWQVLFAPFTGRRANRYCLKKQSINFMDNQNKPLITVVTVCYNAVNELEETMLSVLNQTYDNIEYIVIDGGSTDGTVDIIKKYADKIAYWVSEPDNGIYDAMNKGIKAATGEWINFMNAGDRFYGKEMIGKVFSSYGRENIKVIYGDVLLEKGEDTLLKKSQSLSFLKIAMPFCHQSSFAHISVYKQGFDSRFRIASDYDFFYRIYGYWGERAFLYMPYPIAVYENVDGLSTIQIRQCRREWLTIRSDNKNCRWYFDYLKYAIKYKILQFKSNR